MTGKCELSKAGDRKNAGWLDKIEEQWEAAKSDVLCKGHFGEVLIEMTIVDGVIESGRVRQLKRV